MESYLSSIDMYMKEKEEEVSQSISVESDIWLDDIIPHDFQLSDPIFDSSFYLNSTPDISRKKPGRKPNPASPALRKAQNRAAQRAFRERKEHHLRNLENTIRQLKETGQKLKHDLNQTQQQLESFQLENWYLKGLVLTLQFMCLHHNIRISRHGPYLTDSELDQICHDVPYQKEAYLNVVQACPKPIHPSSSTRPTLTSLEAIDPIRSDERTRPTLTSLEAIDPIRSDERTRPTLTSLEAIDPIRSDERTRPTLLQRSIPHDPRIDLIPTSHMRDRMIIFRDQMDYDRCFGLLLEKAVFHGGDPTLSDNWELPPDFFHEFWFLAIDYDLKKTNGWRRLKGLPDLSSGFKDKGPAYYYERMVGTESRAQLSSPTYENIVHHMKSL